VELSRLIGVEQIAQHEPTRSWDERSTPAF
jgi:hypothetical protein